MGSDQMARRNTAADEQGSPDRVQRLMTPDGSEIDRLQGFRLNLKIEFRRCRRDDLEALEWWGQFSEHREIIRAAFERQRLGELVMLLADLEGFPIGQVWIDFRPTPRTEEGKISASLWAVRVLPPLRNQGIGEKLMLAAEEIVRGRRYDELALTVERSNPGAKRFYERLGYRTSGNADGEYSYRSPTGQVRRIPLNQWVMRKPLPR